MINTADLIYHTDIPNLILKNVKPAHLHWSLVQKLASFGLIAQIYL